MDQGKDAEELTAAARQEDGIWFYVTGDADIAKIFGLNKAPALVLLKKQNEKRSTFGMISFFWSHESHALWSLINMQTTKIVCL